VLTAPGHKLLVDFSMRRAHGAELALLATRAHLPSGDRVSLTSRHQ
jgi:nicotinic acid phosphoribosyltransferase